MNKTNWASFAKIAISVLAITGLLYFLIKFVSFSEIVKIFSNASKFYITLAFISIVAGTFLKIHRFALVNRYYGYSLPFNSAAMIQTLGIALATITPGRVGEAIKIVLLHKRKTPLATAIGICVFERVLDIIFLGIAALAFALLEVKNTRIMEVIVFINLLVIAILLFLKYPERFAFLIPKRFERIAGHLKNLKFRGNPAALLGVVVSTIFVWVAVAGLQYFALLSFGKHISFLLVLGVSSISTIMALFSFLPDGLGVTDFSLLVLYTGIGVSHEIALSTILIYRFFGTLVIFMAVVVALKMYGFSWSRIMREYKTENG